MDGERFDRLARLFGGPAESRRGVLQALTAGGLGLWLAERGLLDAEAKKRKKRKRKKKKRCKKTWNSCSGNKKCCNKRCCLNFGFPGKFCGPKGSICCPEGGACTQAFPICCDPEIVLSCAEAGRPVCCPANVDFPEGYSCLAGYECCTEAEGYCCLVAGALAAESGAHAGPGALKSRLSND